jgi:hypothetical protein
VSEAGGLTGVDPPPPPPQATRTSDKNEMVVNREVQENNFTMFIGFPDNLFVVSVILIVKSFKSLT